MDYYPLQKKARHLDFTRPTFNEPIIALPENTKVKSRGLSSYTADDEESVNDFDLSEVPKAKQTENINVYLRLRPIKEQCNFYKFNDNTVIIPQASQLNQLTSTEKHYQFTSIFNDKVDQIQIYDEIVRPILSNPFDISGSTFASYGVSSSGKTYTILGDNSAGLVPRAITQIFTEYDSVIAPYPCAKILNDQISILSDENVEYEIETLADFLLESNKLIKGKPVKNWSHVEVNAEHEFKEKDSVENKIDRLYIWISFVEIYNEKITDLLTNSKNTVRPLKIFSNGGNSYIHGATWLFAPNIDTAFKILRHGLNHIKYAATGINDHSSRSHTILTINMISESSMDYQLSSFKFCDLAGAERTKKTGNMGDRLKEAGGINNSLLVLGRCLEAVNQNQNKENKKHPDRVVPVRDSKLTFLLQRSLSGHEKFVMIVNLYPTAEFLEENLNVLKFGSIANQIVVKKSEVRTFKRQSSRYSYLMQHSSMLNSSMKNESIVEAYESNDESELDDSFKWSSMSADQLRNELRSQKMFIDGLSKKYVEREKEIVVMRMQILEKQKEIREQIVKRNENDVKNLKEYYDKKMENQTIKFQRQINELYSEVDYLERKLRKYNNENEVEESETSEEESEEDIIEIDE
ncbi:hypothetical protein ACKWTF_004203 [Chironomus riparius]